jgi:hypothetical protein
MREGCSCGMYWKDECPMREKCKDDEGEEE